MNNRQGNTRYRYNSSRYAAALLIFCNTLFTTTNVIEIPNEAYD